MPRDAIGVERALRHAFTTEVVDDLREGTGYNPRQRIATAHRLLLTVVEAFLVGQTLSFAALRAIFVRRFGFVRSCPFQKRFKQESAVAFFRAALEHLVDSVVSAAGLQLKGPLARFADVRVYDTTGQRVPPRGRLHFPACSRERAGTKCLVGYSIKTGLLEHAVLGPETASETPLCKDLLPRFARGVLYLFDLGFFERRVFAEAKNAGAHVLMRLKKSAQVRVIGHLDRHMQEVPDWSLDRFLASATSRRPGTLFDLDVLWGLGQQKIRLRLVGVAHTRRVVRWYLTTVPRNMLGARDVVQAYRLRWLIELLFRELKQNADIGRSFTGDGNAIAALTYGAAIAHVVVRSLRVQAALANEVPLEQLRPLACLHVARAFAREIVDNLADAPRRLSHGPLQVVTRTLVDIARERKPSRSRQRIALQLGAIGA